MKHWRQILGALLLGVFLAACGGGGADEPRAQIQMMDPLGDLSRATVTDKTLDGRKQVLSATSAAITVPELFVWAETLLPQAFPKGPETGVGGVYLGVTYTYRCYPNGNCLGVVTAGGPIDGVFALIGGTLEQFGVLSDYACQVTDCAGNAKAGTFDVSAAGQFLLPDFVNGEIAYLGGADQKGYNLAPAKVAKVCFVSNRKGWGAEAQACAAPEANGALKMAGMCSNDEGLVTVWRNDGVQPVELWADFVSAKGWKLAGDLSPKLVSRQVQVGGKAETQHFVQYGDYKPARVVYDKVLGQLTLRFGSDCLGGFVYEQTPKIWKPAPLVPGDLKFLWNGSGKQVGYLDWDKETKEYFVTISGLACGQRANISVYKSKSGTGATVAWQENPYAWLGIQDANATNPLWEKGAGVDFLVRKLLNGDERSIVLGC